MLLVRVGAVLLFSFAALSCQPAESSLPAPLAAAPVQPNEHGEKAEPASGPNPSERDWEAAETLALPPLDEYHCVTRQRLPWIRVVCTSLPDGSGVIEFDSGLGVRATQELLQGGAILKNTVTLRLEPGLEQPVRLGHFHIPTDAELATAEAHAQSAPPGEAYVPTSHAHNLVFAFAWKGEPHPPTVTVDFD